MRLIRQIFLVPPHTSMYGMISGLLYYNLFIDMKILVTFRTSTQPAVARVPLLTRALEGSHGVGTLGVLITAAHRRVLTLIHVCGNKQILCI